MKRQRIKHKASFAQRLAAEAQRLKDQARAMAAGEDRENILRWARQADEALRISDGLRSPGPPCSRQDRL